MNTVIESKYVRTLPTNLRKVDIYGHANKKSSEPQNSVVAFDHRDDAEPVGNYLAQMRIDLISAWFKKTDSQNISLVGIEASYKKIHEDDFFETASEVSEEIKHHHPECDLLFFEDGEYIKEITITVAQASGNIGAIEFITTNNNRNVCIYGQGNDTSQKAPVGICHNFNFVDGRTSVPGYVVGFYGEYTRSKISYLGVYIASISDINYFTKRPYYIMYKMVQDNPQMLAEIGDKLGVVKQGSKYLNTTLDCTEDNSTKTCLYFLDAARNYPELFKAVTEYL